MPICRRHFLLSHVPTNGNASPRNTTTQYPPPGQIRFPKIAPAALSRPSMTSKAEGRKKSVAS